MTQTMTEALTTYRAQRRDLSAAERRVCGLSILLLLGALATGLVFVSMCA